MQVRNEIRLIPQPKRSVSVGGFESFYVSNADFESIHEQASLGARGGGTLNLETTTTNLANFLHKT